MPKRPKFIHPVRAVRQTVGDSLGKKLTQPAFAKMVGVSGVTIQSVELGRLALSVTLANRIFVATGAEPRSLMKKGNKPRDVYGRPYTGRTFTFSNSFNSRVAENIQVRELAGAQLEALLDAASSPAKNRLLPVLVSFDQWLQTTRKEFCLGQQRSKEARSFFFVDPLMLAADGKPMGSETAPPAISQLVRTLGHQ